MADVWTNLLGNEIQTKDGIVPTSKALADKQVVGLYFSAHWCPPCRAFTPVLSVTYDELKDAHGDAVEVVFISSDSDVASFDEYYSEMPFKALPFANHDGKKALGDKYEVKFIPTLVFLNAKGELITKDGQELVADAKGDVAALWEKLTAAIQQ